MTDWRSGAVVLVEFPYTNMQRSKLRPAVVVSSDAYNREREDVILMAITSRLHGAGNFDKLMIEDWQQAGLAKASAVKAAVMTIEAARLRDHLGMLSEKDRASLRAMMQRIFSL